MWKIMKCAVQGNGHIDKNIPCQDKVYSLTDNDVTTIALADGCGSASLSHFGAEFVTKFVCERFCKNFDSIFSNEDGINVKKNIDNEIKEKLKELAKNKGCEIGDLASTLLFVSVKDNHFILAHIGDGIIGFLKGDELKVAQMPKKEGAVNETFFTTSSVALQQMQLIKGELDSISGFVLMSDGTETSLYDKKNEKLADIVKQLMLMCNTHREEVIEKLLQLDFESTIKQKTTDDCSIVIMYRPKEIENTWLQFPTSKLLQLFDLKISNETVSTEFRDYLSILKLLTKRNCSLEGMYSWFHINKKEKKEALKSHLQRLQKLQLIAEIKDNVYCLFVN